MNLLLTPLVITALMIGSFLSIEANAEPLAVSCIGSPEAKHKLIYLHGADTQEPGLNEQWTQYFLKIMADRLDLRIALPRSNEACPPAALVFFPPDAKTACWENPDFDKLIAEVLTARESCFSEDDSYGVMGFSTGGDLATRWMIFSEKYSSQPQWFVPIAIARPYYISPKLKKSLNETPKKITFVIGNKDPGIGRALIRTLRETQTDTQTVEFEGGHVFSPNAVEKAVSDRLQ